MAEMKRQLLEHTMFSPMRRFLALAKKDADTFLDSVQKKDESIIEMLKILHHLGFYHILIPLYELVPYFLTEDLLTWWSGKISELENYGQLTSILNIFHEKAVNYASKCFSIGGSYVWSFKSSVAIMEELLWDSYRDDVESFLEQNDKSNLGILIPGLYPRRLSEKYIVLLETYAFPCLIDMTEQYYDCRTVSNIYGTAAIKMAVKLYANELGWRYYTTFSDSSERVLALSEKELANMHYAEYKNILLYENGQGSITAYLSVQWIIQIRKLTRYAKKILLNDPDTDLLNCSLPVLMQCAGLNDDASDYLLGILEQMNIRDCSCEVFLLGLYRAVAIGRFDEHSKILSYMNAIFNSERISNDLIDVFEDILKFYKALSEELPKRFEKETLEELISHANEDDKRFYEVYLSYCEHKDDKYFKNVKWAYDCLFSGNKLISRFETQLNRMKDPGSKYSTRILHMQLLQGLFASLTSHLRQEVRIAVSSCLAYLGINETQYTIENNEVFMVYSHSQHLRLIELAERLELEMAHIPSYSTVEQFERIQFEGTEVTRQMIERIENGVRLNKERIEQMETVQKYNDIIHKYILKYTSDKDGTLNQMIMEALVNNKELTLEFCNSIHEICKNSETMNLPAENIELLKRIEILLESAVSHPEEYQNKIIQNEFLSAVKCFADCVPGAGNILSLTQGMRSLKKAFDTLGEMGFEVPENDEDRDIE